MAVGTPPRPSDAEAGGGPAWPAGGRPRAVTAIVGAVTASVLVGTAVVVAALLNPSGSGPEPAPAQATTTAPALVPGEPDGTQEAVVADRYLAFEEAFTQAAQIPEPTWPGLGETATGTILERTVDQLKAWKASGRVVRYPPGTVRILRPSTIQIEGRSATVRACEADGGQVVIAETGTVVNGEVVTRLQVVTLVLDDQGVWKVSDITVEQRWEGVTGCAV